MGHFLDHTWSDNPNDKEKVGPKRNPNKQLIRKKKKRRDDESNLFPIRLSKTICQFRSRPEKPKEEELLTYSIHCTRDSSSK